MDQTPSATEIARALAARRRRVEGHCAVCGTPISGVVNKRYCGNACRLRASRQRRRAITEAEQGESHDD